MVNRLRVFRYVGLVLNSLFPIVVKNECRVISITFISSMTARLILINVSRLNSKRNHCIFCITWRLSTLVNSQCFAYLTEMSTQHNGASVPP